jgi:hypothetical protein
LFNSEKLYPLIVVGLFDIISVCALFIYRLHASMMRLSSAAFSLARLHVTRAKIGGRPSVPFIPTRSKSISLVARRRFVMIVARTTSTMTHVNTLSTGGSGRSSTDPKMIGAVVGGVGLYLAIFGLYFAIASDFDSHIKDVRSDVEGLKKDLKNDFKGEINLVTTMLESKLDGQDRKIAGQDRKLAGQDCKLAGQDRIVDGIGEKVDLQPLKFELKKYWSWFGLSASPVDSENQTVNDVVSKVTKNVDAKVNAAVTNIHAAVTDKLEAMLKELKAETGDRDRVNDGNSSKK